MFCFAFVGENDFRSASVVYVYGRSNFLDDLKILLVDDHALVRDGLRSLLERLPMVQRVEEASNGREALDRIQSGQPDLVIMDVAMPNLNGIDACRQIRKTHPRTRVLMLSMHSDRQIVRSAMDAGASGYCIKGSNSNEFLEAIRRISEGRQYLSPAISEKMYNPYSSQADENLQPPHERLTPREREILQLLSEGTSTRNIAASLGVSIKTVETHRRNIMQKMNVYSVAELTKHAIRAGITSL